MSVVSIVSPTQGVLKAFSDHPHLSAPAVISLEGCKLWKASTNIWLVSKPKAETKQDLARWSGGSGLKDYLKIKEQYMLIPSRLLGRLIYLVINEYFSNAEI